MERGQLPDVSLLSLLLADPLLLTGMLLPIVLVGGILFFRIRAWRRLNVLATRSDQRGDRMLDRNDQMWREAAARTERMIALLTEIRDHVARMAPAQGAAGPTPPSSNPGE